MNLELVGQLSLSSVANCMFGSTFSVHLPLDPSFTRVAGIEVIIMPTGTSTDIQKLSINCFSIHFPLDSSSTRFSSMHKAINISAHNLL